MKKILFATLISSASISSVASAVSLLKAADNALKNTDIYMVAPITKMSEAGRAANENIKKEFWSGTKAFNTYEKEYLVLSRGIRGADGQDGLLTTLRNYEDGSVSRTAFHIPESNYKPSKFEITSATLRDGYDVGWTRLTREFETNNGLVAVEEVLKVTWLGKIPYRTLDSFKISTENLTATVKKGVTNESANDLFIKIKGTKNGEIRFSASIEAVEIHGEMIGFKLSADGERLTTHVANGPEIKEMNYFLNSETRRAELKGSKNLTKAEISKLGLIGDRKFLEPRKTVHKPTRGMDVEDTTTVGSAQ